MADPRDEAAYDGIAAHYTTYEHDNTIVFDATKTGGSEQAGLAVTIVDDKKVGLVGDGQAVKGKLILVEAGGMCNVQDEGYLTGMKVGDGGALTPGAKVVGDLGPANAKGYIRDVNAAVAAELLAARGEVIDATDAADATVKL
jgi:hypothetical protein